MVCDDWHDITLFVDDMGLRPPHTTLDRKNPNGNYDKENCRWSSLKQQAQNRRNTKLSKRIVLDIKKLHKKKKLTQQQIAKQFGLNQSTVSRVISGLLTW
ncbi:MAG: helix-turn-helix domain-containing protein [Thaumarchaeota archaeon]|nr:helix-turn-helix domain-containing protein [Nitrososphaerota archaeon]